METIPAVLALNGVLVVFLSSAAGLALYVTLLRRGDPHDWHLLHAGGAARGVLLIGLAGVVHLLDMPPSLATAAAWLIIAFVWASTLAMTLRGVTGETGFGFSGALANRIGFVLYVIGVLALLPGLILLGWGFARAL